MRVLATRRCRPASTRLLLTSSSHSAEGRIVVLIDGENARPQHLREYLQEASKYGKISIKNVFGDWSRGMSGWNRDAMNSHAVR